jgi:hypothetical protein
MPAAPGGRPNGDAPTFFFHHASYGELALQSFPAFPAGTARLVSPRDPFPLFFHTVPGYFLVPGVFNDSARGGQLYADLWLYNIAKNTWVNPYE